MKKTHEYTAKKQSSIMLNANELYQNVDAQIMEEIIEEIKQIPFHRYPDETSSALIEAYTPICKLDHKHILAGNGSDEMLGLLIGSTLGKGKKLYTLAPDFSMYHYYAGMYEADVITYACGVDGSFDIDQFIEKGKQQQVDMILFSNPNNPTGHFLTNAQVCKIVEAFSDIVVVIDEAYGEFAKESMLAYVSSYTNVYITRTLSKAYGLAGARLGFVISNPNNVDRLRRFMVPYNISSITQSVGKVVLRHYQAYDAIITHIKAARDALYQKVSTLQHITFYPSQANYLFARCKQKAQLIELFNSQGVSIREYQDDSLRITIGSDEENAMVYQILQTFEQQRNEATL